MISNDGRIEESEAGVKVFIWDSIETITDAYHDGGALLIIAENLEHAQRLWDSERGERPLLKVLPEPTHQWPIEASPQVMVFPNAGCC